MPWDLVATGAKRFLRLSYLAAVVSGGFVLAEITILSLDGPPAHRRDTIGGWLHRLPHVHASSALVLIIAAVALLIAYMTGVVARTVALSGYVIVNFIYQELRLLVERALYRPVRLRGVDFDHPAPPVEARPRELRVRLPRVRRRRSPPPYAPVREVREPAMRRWFRKLRRLLRAVVAPIFPPRLEADAVWSALAGQFGRERIAEMLDRHPISLLFGESEDRVASAFPYCRLWLQRYASDVSVPTAARKTVVLLAAVVPAALLPATLHSIAADASSVRPLLAWVWVFLLIAAAVAVANSLREGRTLVLSIFYQFVLVQFVEQGAPSRDRREGESRSDIASDA